jgi:cell division protease FtsH
LILTPKDKKVTAYHEAGHALVAYHTDGADPVHKVTIIPRGMAMGVTAQLPEDEKFNYQKKYLLGRLNILMGGRCAEKLIFHDTSTGAGNDIATATDMARKMVCEWGMSSEIGPLTFGKKSEEVFLGKEISHSRDYSDEISKMIDKEIIALVKNAEKKADQILLKNIDELHRLATGLLDLESINGEEMKQLINNEKVIRIKINTKPKKSRRRKKNINNSEETLEPIDSPPIIPKPAT